ncbi:hypothetical protein HMN09_00982900 [Mycena chlorophos]|uniref:CN hydrolase domain-containing protein n=1 Tax=Mycena chlorophos TaxID=658473 RepID=A0A8H6SL04_MYCCL|nr:hypothetical protein HMN09_00982900 [Mycena chlorophos]
MASPASIRAAPRIRVALVQLRPKLGQVQANITRAKELCRRITPYSVDLVCFPELAFSGYAFSNADAIEPYLELPRTGPTSVFCAELAKNLGCCVIAGYPERLDASEIAVKTAPDASSSPATPVSVPRGANSAALFGPDGNWLGGSRKTNLFMTDTTWAKAGNGFATFTIPLRGGADKARVSVGICMDLNAAPPYDWTIADGPYELADYTLSENADVLVLLNAWLDSKEYIEHPYDLSTISFWSKRLRPLWADSHTDTVRDASRSDTLAQPTSNGSSDRGRETLVVVCNRGGAENDTQYAGSSAVFQMRRGAGESGALRAALRRADEKVLVWPETSRRDEDEEDSDGGSSTGGGSG